MNHFHTKVATACPFLFPFETRQLLFYVTSFDRDRALLRLLDSVPELGAAENGQVGAVVISRKIICQRKY